MEEITLKFVHKNVLRKEDQYETQTFRDYREKNPALGVYNTPESYPQRETHFTYPNYRKIIKGPVKIAVQARKMGYVVSEDTFRVDNILMLGDIPKFWKVKATPVGDFTPGYNNDFEAAADLIENKIFQGYETRQLPTEVTLLLNRLRTMEWGGEREEDTLELLQCHYAYASDMRRRLFAEWTVARTYEGDEKTSLEWACYNLDENEDWRTAAQEEASPLSAVYYYDGKSDPYKGDRTVLVKFTRNAIKHVHHQVKSLEGKPMSKNDNILMVTSYLPNIVPKMHDAMFNAGLIHKGNIRDTL